MFQLKYLHSQNEIYRWRVRIFIEVRKDYLNFCIRHRVYCKMLTCPVSVSNLYSLKPGLFGPSLVCRGDTDGATIAQEIGRPVT